MAVGLTGIDRFSPGATARLGWAYGGEVDRARALLSAVAGSMITVVSVTFSVLMVALTVSSQHFGPRLLGNFMRDQPAQLVLGAFTGTFAYCLMVLRTMQGEGDGYSTFVPHLAVAGAIVLALIAVGPLIYYVHHIAVSVQVSELTRRIAHGLEKALDHLYPESIGESAELPLAAPPVPDRVITVPSAQTGYVQAVNGDGLMRAARAPDTTIWLRAQPGAFVIDGEPIAVIAAIDGDSRTCIEAIQQAFAYGRSNRMPGSPCSSSSRWRCARCRRG